MLNRIKVDADRIIGEVHPHIYGHFLEQAGRIVNGGVYEPGSPLADKEGFRKDVIAALKRIRPGIVRWPGGNFASAYHWQDGIGPKAERPTVYDPAWFSEDSNQFGTPEFISLCRKIGAEPHICVNMGSGSLDEAMHWVEYCNRSGRSQYAQLRAEHGYEEPFAVRYWGLGNEMYNAFQVGHLEALDYARRAIEYAKVMKFVDSSIKTIAVGVTNPKFADWNRPIMEAARDPIPVGYDRLAPFDYISFHAYCVPPITPDYYTVMALPTFFENHTRVMRAGIIAALRSVHPWVKIAWDEWNLFGWFLWTDKPEYDHNDRYTLEDALFTAIMFNGFQRQCSSVSMANHSPPVNETGLIFTYAEGIVLRPQYHVFDLYANHCGRLALDAWWTCDSYDREIEIPGLATGPISLTDVRYLDVSATLDPEEKRLALAVVNRHRDKAITARVELPGFGVGDAKVYRIHHEDVNAFNDVACPNDVAVEESTLGTIDGEAMLEFPAHSISLVEVRMRE